MFFIVFFLSFFFLSFYPHWLSLFSSTLFSSNFLRLPLFFFIFFGFSFLLHKFRKHICLFYFRHFIFLSFHISFLSLSMFCCFFSLFSTSFSFFFLFTISSSVFYFLDVRLLSSWNIFTLMNKRNGIYDNMYRKQRLHSFIRNKLMAVMDRLDKRCMCNWKWNQFVSVT